MTAPSTPVTAPGQPGQPVADEDARRRRRKVILAVVLLALLAALVLLAIWYLLFRQQIRPIPLIPDTELPGYSTSIYGVEAPAGIAVSSSGDRIYVAQTEGERLVRVFDGGGTSLGTLTPPASTGTDHVPVYVAIDPLTDEVYVTDRPTGTIYVYGPDGSFVREFRPAEPRPGWQPLGIAFDPAGNLLVTDLSGTSPSVAAFDREGRLLRTLGEDESLSFPNGIALDAVGNVYVSDSNNGRLLVFDAAGEIVARIGRGAAPGNLGLPRGTAIDSNGRVFVVDTTGQGVSVYRTVREQDKGLDFIGFVGRIGVGDGEFAFPIGAAVDGRGRLYVADSANNRVQVWSY